MAPATGPARVFWMFTPIWGKSHLLAGIFLPVKG
jgi:hypothetical protein